MPNLDKLGKILPMLSSPHAGEVVSAASAISRVLESEGKDWHWLVSKLSGQGGGPFGPSSSRVNDGALRAAESALRQAQAESAVLRGKVLELEWDVRCLGTRNAQLTRSVRTLTDDNRRLNEENRRLKAGAAQAPPDEPPAAAEGDVTLRRWRWRVLRMLSELRYYSDHDVTGLRVLRDALSYPSFTLDPSSEAFLGTLWKRYKAERLKERGTPV